MQRRNITLQRAVGLHRDKSPFGSQAAALNVDQDRMRVVDFWNNHRYIWGSPVRTVIGDDRTFQLGICLFQHAGLSLIHIDRAENKVHHTCDFFHVSVSVHHDHLFHRLRHWSTHCPAGTDRILVSSACGTGRRC